MFSVNSASGQAQTGADLTEVQTEGIGFQALAGETRLKLLPAPWPPNALPKPTSTLLSIAPRSELLAAAGPDTLVIASTPTVREAFVKEGPVENSTKSFTPQLTISIPRISHLAFSSDENYLAICADEGGGLLVYEVQELKKGNTRSSFELGTNSTAVRALVPNPAPENGHVTAIVLQNGQLLLANLRERQLASGKHGMVLKDGVSCISWSSKGKQLVAGLGNGTAVQMDPEGDVKAEIPRPPALSGDQHVSGISWLANDLFFIIYTPTFSEHEGVPDSTYMLVTRQPKTANYTFQKMQDPVGTFGMNRSPPHHFILRMRDFPPNLSDVLLLSSTASGDIGMITCSKTPLSSDASAANTANIYTTTSIANDARRAQMPVNDQQDEMSDESMDTSPIGMIFDLSSKDNVKQPIPTEEIESTSTPLPALMVLNNQGVLSAWWFVYSESVRQGTIYPGLVVAPGSQASTHTQTQPQSSPFSIISQGQTQPSLFGSPLSAQQQSSPFGALSQSTPFGTSNAPNTNSLTKPTTSAFGAPSALGGSLSNSQGPSFASFGSTSQTGVKASPWSSGPTGAQFGQHAFGSASQIGTSGSAFGSSGGLGEKKSVWGTPAAQPGSAATTDKPANPFSNVSAASPFANLGAQQSATSEKSFSLIGGNTTTSSASPFSALSRPQSKSAFESTPSSVISTQPSAFGIASSLSNNKLFSETAKTAGNRVQSPLAKEPFSIDTSSDADMDSGAMEEDNVTADKPSKPSASLFGTETSGFQLGSSFKADRTAQDDAPRQYPTSGGSFFNSAFGDALADERKAPVRSIKEEPKSPEPQAIPSETPAATIKPQHSQSELFPKSAQVATSPRIENAQEPNKLEEPPLPPSPTPRKMQPQATTATFPPIPQVPQQATEEAPSPAGSPPVDLGEASSSALSSGESDHDEEGNESDDAPLPPDFVSKPLSQPTWSFPPSEKRDVTSGPGKSMVPSTEIRSTNTEAQTPNVVASLAKPPVLFSQPSAQVMPRSPSPVRDSRPILGQHSLTTPTAAPQQPSTTPLGPPPTTLLSRPQDRSPLFPASPKPPTLARDNRQVFNVEPDEPLDNSDEVIREELARPIELTKKLAPFLAHQDYVGKVGGEGVAAQAERLYRDMNSMIDTLGLNARSLSCFIEGHSELYPDDSRERADLEDDDWCLDEVEDLGVVQKNLGDQLDAERPRDIKEKLSSLRGMQLDSLKLRSRHHDLQKVLLAQNNSAERRAGGRSEPLTSEQSTMLSDLRNEFATFQNQLVAAEDAISLLKAKLAAIQSYEDDVSGSNKVPTVEAVVNTIAKMTRMIEQKSGDVDLLEAQMRKLRFRAKPDGVVVPSNLEEALGRMSIGSAGGRGDSPFTTPPSSKAKTAKFGVYQLTYSADTSDDEDPSQQRSLRRSLGTGNQVVHKSSHVSDIEIRAYTAKQERRQQFLHLLKDKVLERATKQAGQAA